MRWGWQPGEVGRIACGLVCLPERLPLRAALLVAGRGAGGNALGAVDVVELVGLVGLFPGAGAGCHGVGSSKKEAPLYGGAVVGGVAAAT